MTDQHLTHLYFLLDRSGSMQSIREETVAGFGAFIDEQRNVPGVCRVTLAQFDHEYDEVYADRDLADVPALQLTPRGSTALLDALGRTIVEAGERLAALPEEQRHALVRREVDGLSHAQVARELGLTEQATKSLVFRARGNLVREREARSEACHEVRADLLEAADAAVRPAHGELADSGFTRAHLAVTAATGVAAGEELLGWLRDRAAADSMTVSGRL
jgi:hypothetical protein